MCIDVALGSMDACYGWSISSPRINGCLLWMEHKHVHTRSTGGDWSFGVVRIYETGTLRVTIMHSLLLAFSSQIKAATNPEMADLVPHKRGQGMLDLEFESDG